VLDIWNVTCWFCGPEKLGARVKKELRQIGNTKYRSESFRWR
jgi:predicted ferric reductase